MTALLEHLRRRIRLEGPVSVAEFMAEALGNPRHGYYMTADRFGAEGDFVTAPEISQMFGELVGLWCADLWDRLGRPDPFLLAEFGPGRGTLMADALRGLSGILPEFVRAARLHLVETSPVLRARQAQALAAHAPVWHDRVGDLPEGPPLLAVANEFFDALPIRQFQRVAGGWAERLIGLDAETETLRFVLGPRNAPSVFMMPPRLRDLLLDEGTVIDVSPASIGIAHELGRRLATQGGGALIVDYGHAAPVPTDTLQALRRHAFVPVLEDPGEADLTAHVDFGTLAAAASEAGAVARGPVGQGALLRTLGIEARAALLGRAAAPAQRAALTAAVERLTGDAAMGTLFKALALTAPDGPVPAGFD